jgi:hypothetical protein
MMNTMDAASNEKLTTAELIVRITVEAKPSVHFSLDEPSSAGVRLWYSQPVKDELPAPDQPLDDIVPASMTAGMAVVHELVPSVETNHLSVQLGEADGVTEVVGFGTVQFLQSEWDAVKAGS